ncbi:PLP-dependent aminotransferase family protein [Cohnella lubricantis]|uniref:PLP-dependent aminotransferase family protein n=1 Tax=Cohnella lubricantis TaxID=2163172 RepID=A0A841TC74_9BACL|nr:PLP-dependent aminotransferase family protein [Cohnella lubricantis]MBB6679073.1 PLP-dependent aminotransferase family protein [Cohnella lubricantis]MBP2116683.1 2-aminoadipate transaminase [Cohnella lubricantis]
MGGIINWMGGWPKEGLLSASEWEARCAAAARGLKPAGDTGAASGDIRLREKLAADGLLFAPAEDIGSIALAPGADAALDRAARCLLAPGDNALAERLTSRSALHILRKAGADVHAVAADEFGMIPEELSRSIEQLRPRLVYAAPNGTDPEGRVWSDERRLALLQICAEAEVPVVIDDRQAGLQFDSRPGAQQMNLPDRSPIASTAEQAGDVWTIGELPPGTIAGLRFGWVTVSGRTASGWERMTDSRNRAEGVPAAEQLALLSLMEGEELEPLLIAMRFVCRAKLGLLIEQLELQRLPGAAWREPNAGMHLWLALPEGLDSDALLRAAWQNGLLFQPGGAFYAADPERARLRLTPVHSDERQIRAGVARLAETMGEFLGRWV